MSSFSLADVGPQVRIAAAAIVKHICAINDAQRTQRRQGMKKRWKRLKQKDPMQKDMRATPDLIQRCDSLGAAKPSPM